MTILCFSLILLANFLNASLAVHSRGSPRLSEWGEDFIVQAGDLQFPMGVVSAATDLQTIMQRRANTITNAVSGGNDDVDAWLRDLSVDGKWPDNQVNYATQCAAQRANWPAQEHWRRILVMAAQFNNGTKLNMSKYETQADKATVRDAISRAMNWWFARDFQNPDCQDAGDTLMCPCKDPPTPAAWLFNTNWYSNMILIPGFVGRTCVVLNSTLTKTEYGNCTKFTTRSFDNFIRVSPVHGANFLTGANTLDVATIGVDGAVVTNNATWLADAYSRIHGEMVITQTPAADGIRPDGSFGQHDGLLYNGNYGKDYTNVVLGLEYASGATPYEAPASAKSAFETLVRGDRWMIYRNTLTKVLHWDFSTLPRFITFPVYDNQATANLQLNLSAFKVLGDLWNSQTLLDFEHDLTYGGNISTNAGNVLGNRMFYANDYMVHRGGNYVTTLKMFSKRTKNTECTNSQNAYGFHLADGTLYTYVRGDEYEDIAASWDWNAIPGITTDYGVTPLNCGQASVRGIEPFVGGASDGIVGVSVMRYTNPLTKTFGFQKAWFFLEEDLQHVVVSAIRSSAPVLTVLDQRRASGSVHFDNTSVAGQATLWHGGVGYRILDPQNTFSVNQTVRKNVKGNWQLIGTSTSPPTSVDLFTASVTHKALEVPLEYTIYPGTDYEDSFPRKLRQMKLFSVRTDSDVTAVYDKTHATAFIVFWNSVGGSVDFLGEDINKPFNIQSTSAGVVIYKQWCGNVTVADPSQTLQSMDVTINMKDSWPPTKTFTFSLPQGGEAGKSVTQNIFEN